MTHSLRILPRAKEDFRHIFWYIEAQSPQGAARWKDAFRLCIDEVANDPERFALAPENELIEIQIQQTFFKTPRGLTYRAVFTVRDGTVFILRIRGPGQPPLAEDELPVE